MNEYKYKPTTWIGGKTIGTADVMNNIEEGIEKAHERLDSVGNVSGGLNSVAKSLLISILQNAVFVTNQSENIKALNDALNSSSTPSDSIYTITNTLTNVTTSNNLVFVTENSPYSTILKIDENCVLETVIITMNGIDITPTVLSGTVINIPKVTGNVVIIATAIQTSAPDNTPGGNASLIKSGLVDYFDFRNCEYNNLGSGGSTIISSSEGSGGLYCWANNAVTEQNEYGIKATRSMSYSTGRNTTTSSLGNSFSWVFKCYMTEYMSPMFSSHYGSASNVQMLTYNPSYINSSNQTVKAGNQTFGEPRTTGYVLLSIIVNNNICKFYKDNVLINTIDGNSISDFSKWFDQLNLGILGNNTAGYMAQLAIYNKALSDVEVVENMAYFKTLEVE